MNTTNMNILLLLPLLNLSACTTYSIGKFNSVMMNAKNDEVVKETAKKVNAKDCITQFFPKATHDVENVLKMMCPTGHTVRDVEIHEEFWSILVVGQSCTVASGICIGGSNE